MSRRLAVILIFPIFILGCGIFSAKQSTPTSNIPTKRPTVRITPKTQPTESPNTTDNPTKPSIFSYTLGSELYTADFSGSDWDKFESDNCQAEANLPRFVITLKKEDWFCFKYAGSNFTNFMAHTVVSANQTSVTAYGLVFRRVDAKNYYNLNVSNNGSIRFDKKVNDEWVEILDWFTTPSIKTGTALNDLKLVVLNDQFAVIINDKVVTTVRDKEFSEGSIGINCDSYQDQPVTCTYESLVINQVN
jgi:hypothetical protein